MDRTCPSGRDDAINGAASLFCACEGDVIVPVPNTQRPGPSAAPARAGQRGPLAIGRGALTNRGADGIAHGMGTTDLKAQIDDLSEKLRALVREGVDRQIEATKTRLEYYREAYELVSGQPVGTRPTASNGVSARAIVTTGEACRGAALVAMRTKGGQFSTDDILASAKEHGAEVPRHSAPRPLAELVARRTLKRIREGVSSSRGTLQHRSQGEQGRVGLGLAPSQLDQSPRSTKRRRSSAFSNIA